MRKIKIALFVLAACFLAIGVASYFNLFNLQAMPQVQPATKYYS